MQLDGKIVLLDLSNQSDAALVAAYLYEPVHAIDSGLALRLHSALRTNSGLVAFLRKDAERLSASYRVHSTFQQFWSDARDFLVRSGKPPEAVDVFDESVKVHLWETGLSCGEVAALALGQIELDKRS